MSPDGILATAILAPSLLAPVVGIGIAKLANRREARKACRTCGHRRVRHMWDRETGWICCASADVVIAVEPDGYERHGMRGCRCAEWVAPAGYAP